MKKSRNNAKTVKIKKKDSFLSITLKHQKEVNSQINDNLKTDFMDKFVVEVISNKNLKNLTGLFLELWPDCDFDEELENCKEILSAENETCILIKVNSNYVAFIQLAIRSDYVEGSTHSPTAYIEGIYVKENYRHLGLSKKLLKLAEEWGKQKNCKQLASDTELSNSGSIEFHKRVGFQEVNRIVCFIKDIS